MQRAWFFCLADQLSKENFAAKNGTPLQPGPARFIHGQIIILAGKRPNQSYNDFAAPKIVLLLFLINPY